MRTAALSDALHDLKAAFGSPLLTVNALLEQIRKGLTIRTTADGLEQCFPIFFLTWLIMSLGESEMALLHYLVGVDYVVVGSMYLVTKQTHIILKQQFIPKYKSVRDLLLNTMNQ